MKPTDCGQSDRDAAILAALNPEIIFYGPHPCQRCGKTIARAAQEQGGIEFDYPEGPIYPNTNWVQHFCLANFPRGSQNQTVSSGVEGAHEGIAADESGPRFHGEWFCPQCKQKTVNIYIDNEAWTSHFHCENCDWHGDKPGAGPREPEKLNNAQKSALDELTRTVDTLHRLNEELALAESSLSSPPPNSETTKERK